MQRKLTRSELMFSRRARLERVVALHEDSKKRFVQAQAELRDAMYGIPSAHQVEQLRDNTAALGKLVDEVGAGIQELEAALEHDLGLIDDLLRTIFTLSTGALVLSITFQSNLVPENPVEIIYLKAAWCLFGATIVAYTFRSLTLMFSLYLQPPSFWEVVHFYGASLIMIPGFMLGCYSLLRFALANLP